MDINGWLRGIGLEQYAQTFRDNAIDADVLCDLTDEHLREPVLDTRRMRFEHEAAPVCVHERMALTSVDLLSSIVTARPAVIPRGFSNQPWIRHVDANHSTAA